MCWVWQYFIKTQSDPTNPRGTFIATNSGLAGMVVPGLTSYTISKLASQRLIEHLHLGKHLSATPLYAKTHPPTILTPRSIFPFQNTQHSAPSASSLGWRRRPCFSIDIRSTVRITSTCQACLPFICRRHEPSSCVAASQVSTGILQRPRRIKTRSWRSGCWISSGCRFYQPVVGRAWSGGQRVESKYLGR